MAKYSKADAEAKVKALLSTGRVAQAAVLDEEGSVLFSLPPQLHVSKKEGLQLLAGFQQPEPIMAIGIVVGGTKYMTLRVTPEIIVGKHGTSGVAVAKASHFILVGIHDEKSTIDDCMQLVGTHGK